VLHFVVMKRVETFLRELLLSSGALLKHHFGRVRTITYKNGASTNLVTNVDQEVEEYIKRKIRKAYPEDSILAEESPIFNSEAPRRWIIDPLDGTTNFAHGYPCFSISIGVESDRHIIAGGVYSPIEEEFFFAVKGKGATWNGKKIRVSKIKKLDQSLLVTGFPYDVHTHPERSLPYFNSFIQTAQGVRRLGSAAIDLCYVAMGRFDGFFEVQLNPWDTSAGMLILMEGGGVLTDFSGKEFSIYRPEIVASNGQIHHQMIQVIKKTRSNKREATIF